MQKYGERAPRVECDFVRVGKKLTDLIVVECPAFYMGKRKKKKNVYENIFRRRENSAGFSIFSFPRRKNKNKNTKESELK